MANQIDLVIRGGTIYDGSGGAPFVGDIAVDKGVIVKIGRVAERGREDIDASGLIVTPGFLDIHTHYDGQATWSNRLAPSSNHGVTTVVMGNCGVGFAPCRPQDHQKLVELMEGVEDIPGIVMTEGLPWTWEGFPSYLNFLEARQFDMDVAGYLPHAALRVYVMGERALRREEATDADIAEMARLTEEAMKAGALGFATSRSINHKSIKGELIVSYSASEKELIGIANGMKRAGRGVLQFISDFERPEEEFAMLRRVAEQTERRVTFSLIQMPQAPDRWRTILDAAEKAKKEGLPITAQVCGRPIGVYVGLELGTNPFSFCPSYEAISGLPLAERLKAMRDPALRQKIVSEYPADSWQPIAQVLKMPEHMYQVAEKPKYEPTADESIAAQAAQRGLTPAEHLYNVLTEGNGKTVLYIPIVNYVGRKIDAVEAMMRSPVTVPGLGDGGAHYTSICDASLPTYNLMRWTSEGSGKFTLPAMVRALTADCAEAVDLKDRGRIAVGLRGDLNIIDLKRLSLGAPHLVRDLPAGGGRLEQTATGYVATIVAGQATYRNGKATGALPGRLIRGNRTGASA